ncbi:MAG: hypothetical protein FJ194_04620 [Gammaproteobacteria bacterium]|nr:hypothetical protein [Gammaproteobacteria bacterium]
MYREFLLGHTELQSVVGSGELPDALLRRMLELDPIFIPAIDAVLTGYVSRPDAAALQVEFLEQQLDGHLLWMARENQEAAAMYGKFLSVNAGSPERRKFWDQQQKMVVRRVPLRERRWFF